MNNNVQGGHSLVYDFFKRIKVQYYLTYDILKYSLL